MQGPGSPISTSPGSPGSATSDETRGKNSTKDEQQKLEKIRPPNSVSSPHPLRQGKDTMRAKVTTKKSPVNKQKLSRLVLPIAKVSKFLKRQGIAGRMQKTAPIFTTAVVEYITGEILELAGNVAKDAKKNRITPRHIQLAVRGDEELSKFLGHVTIAGGGVMPNIQQQMLPKKDTKPGKPVPGSSNQVSQEY